MRPSAAAMTSAPDAPPATASETASRGEAARPSCHRPSSRVAMTTVVATITLSSAPHCDPGKAMNRPQNPQATNVARYTAPNRLIATRTCAT